MLVLFVKNDEKILLVFLCCYSSVSLVAIGIAERQFESVERDRVIETELFYPTAATEPAYRNR